MGSLLGKQGEPPSVLGKQGEPPAVEEELQDQPPLKRRRQIMPPRPLVELNEAQQGMIEKFKESYNGFYLKDLPNEFFQDENSWLLYYRTMTAAQRLLFENVAKLRFNAPTYKQFTFIEGPHAVDVIKARDTTTGNVKMFYLFGEHHDMMQKSKGKCSVLDRAANQSNVTTITEYLKALVTNTPQFIDFYLETHFFNEKTFQHFYYLYRQDFARHLLGAFKRNPRLDWTQSFKLFQSKEPDREQLDFTIDDTTTNILAHIFKSFIVCFEPKLRKGFLYCQLARFHVTDIRQQMFNTNDLLFQLSFCEDFLLFDSSKQYRPILSKDDVLSYKPRKMNQFDYLYTVVINICKLFGLYNLVLKLTKKSKGITLCNYIIKRSPLLTKELDETKVSPVMKKIIVAYISKIIDKDKIVSRLRRAFRWLLLIKSDKKEETLMFLCSMFNDCLFDLSTYMMDLYHLARIFRTFTHKPDNPLDQPTVPSTYIVYAGSAHTRLYANFIKHLVAIGKLSDAVMYNQDSKEAKSKKVTPCVNLPAEHQI